MLKRSLLCSTHHSEVTPLETASFFSIQPKRLMAGRYFTLGLVVMMVLVSAVAVAQTQAPSHTQGPTCDTVGNCLMFVAPATVGPPLEPLQITDLPPNSGTEEIPVSNLAPWNSGIENPGGAGFNDIDNPTAIQVFSNPVFRNAAGFVDRMGKAESVGAATVIGGWLSGIYAIESLFPSKGGVHCDGVEASCGMLPFSGIPEGGFSMQEPEFESMYERPGIGADAYAYTMNRAQAKRIIEGFAAEGEAEGGISMAEADIMRGAQNSVEAQIAGRQLGDAEAAREMGRFNNAVTRFMMAKSARQIARTVLFKYAFGLLRMNANGVNGVNDALRAAGLEEIP